MINDLVEAKARLLDGEYTCVLMRGEEVRTSTHRGVHPLVQWLQSGEDLRGFCAADKVVGKATAFLYIRLGVRAVYARVISETALAVLRDRHIETLYDTCVPYIINRRGDGMCPFEKAVLHTDSSDDAYAIILHQWQQINRSAD